MWGFVMTEPETKVPSSPQSEEPVTPVIGSGDLFPPFGGVIESALKLRTFFRTRQRVLAGDALWSLSESEISGIQLMAPWKFLSYQGVLSGSSPWATIRIFRKSMTRSTRS